MQACALPFDSVASLRTFGIHSEVRTYDLRDGIEIERFDPSYLFCFILATNRRQYETQWRLTRKMSLTASALFTLLPANVPLLGLTTEGAYRCVMCSVKAAVFEDTTGLKEWDRDQFTRALAVNAPRFRMLFKRLAGEVEHPGFASAEICHSLSTCLMIEFARTMTNSHARQVKGCLSPPQLRRVQEVIHDPSAIGPLRMPLVAAMCGLSVRHLMRAYKATTGSTIYEHIEEIRTEKTKELLAQGVPVKVIAARMGFANSAHLSVAFKRKTGLTPSDFRRLRQDAAGVGWGLVEETDLEPAIAAA